MMKLPSLVQEQGTSLAFMTCRANRSHKDPSSLRACEIEFCQGFGLESCQLRVRWSAVREGYGKPLLFSAACEKYCTCAAEVEKSIRQEMGNGPMHVLSPSPSPSPSQSAATLNPGIHVLRTHGKASLIHAQQLTAKASLAQSAVHQTTVAQTHNTPLSM